LQVPASAASKDNAKAAGTPSSDAAVVLADGQANPSQRKVGEHSAHSKAARAMDVNAENDGKGSSAMDTKAERSGARRSETLATRLFSFSSKTGKDNGKDPVGVCNAVLLH